MCHFQAAFPEEKKRNELRQRMKLERLKELHTSVVETENEDNLSHAFAGTVEQEIHATQAGGESHCAIAGQAN